jgi:hypothetical protein
MRLYIAAFSLLIFVSAHAKEKVRFFVNNATGDVVTVDVSRLGRYAKVENEVPRTLAPSKDMEIILSVDPGYFDSNNIEGLTLLVGDIVITNIDVEPPLGSALLSAIAHDVGLMCSSRKTIPFRSDQSFGIKTKWKNVITVKSAN